MVKLLIMNFSGRGFPKGIFATAKVMSANQGLYNGFIAAGLI